MKRIFLMIALVAVSLSSCTKKPTCDMTTKYSNIAAKNIGAALQCAKPELIALDIQSAVSKLNLCTNPIEAGAIAAIVCRPAAMVVTQLIVKNALPKTWECTGGMPAQGLESFLYNACSALPF